MMMVSRLRFKCTCTAAVVTPGLKNNRLLLCKAHALIGSSLQALHLRFVGDREMTRLHDQFMQMPWPTDVLTFPSELDAEGQVTHGEVAICVPEARRRAKIEGVSLPNELLLYSLHGLLHLCGYNDQTAREFKKMHAKEDQILTQLGIGPIFKCRARTR